jgi:uncharacterized protein YwqG
MYHPSLPLLLEPYRQQLEKTTLSFVKILPQPAGETLMWQSKIGGNPYLPLYCEYPVNGKGEPLFFLAQINFAEMPGLDYFPTEGILQFYINNSNLLGMNVDNLTGHKDYRVLYFENVGHDPAILHRHFPVMMPDDMLPIQPGHSYPLQFELQQEMVPLTDYRFVKQMGEDFFEPFGQKQWDLQNDYFKMHRSSGHKIGGYAFFTQHDPREQLGDMELLFQLDSDEAIQCRWGDMGVGNFFIRKEDLERRDFSNVLFTWDCY